MSGPAPIALNASWRSRHEPPLAKIRLIERRDRVIDVLAPAGWTNARVEAWLDWAEQTPRDLPPGAAPPKGALDPLLGGGPDAYARRLAAWGIALGVFDAPGAGRFRDDLFAALACGLLAPSPGLARGVRLHPLAADPSEWPVAAPLNASGADAWESSEIAPLEAVLSTVRHAVTRCEGDPESCADPRQNKALARAAWNARAAGASDAELADAFVLGRAGLDIAAKPSEALLSIDRAAAKRGDKLV